MNRTLGAAVLALAGLSAAHVALAQDVADARAFVESYVEKLLGGDFDGAVQVSYQGLITRLGGMASAKLAIGGTLRQQRELGMSAFQIDIDRMTQVSSNDRWVYLVETTHRMPGFPSPMKIPRLYVVSPGVAIGGLEILDLACVSVPWVEEMVPGFSRSSVARDFVARGLMRENAQ